MSNTIRSLVVRVGADLTGLKRGMDQAAKQVNGFTKAVIPAQKSVATMSSSLRSVFRGMSVVAVLYGLKRFSQSAIKLGSDLAEVQNVVDVTFGNSAKAIDDFAKSANRSFGMSELDAKKYSSTLGAMMKSSGLTGDAVYSMSTQLTQLTGDMASFYNLDHEAAFQKIRSGISGETEPLKQLGINLSVANLEAFALAQGIGTAYRNMSQSEQVLLRYQYLMKTTADAQGDFARTSKSWANQTRILNLAWQNFSTTMGQGFINVLTPVLNGLNQLMVYAQYAADAFLAFTQSIFGVQVQAGNLAVGSNNAADGQFNLAEGIKAAGAAARGSLASFDKLNVLQSGGGGGIDSPMPGLPAPNFELAPKLKAAVNDFKDLFDFRNLIESWNNLKTALKPFSEKLWDALKWGWDNVLVPLGKWTINEGLPAVLDLFSGAFELLTEVLEALKPLGKWLWDEFLQPIAKWSAAMLVKSLDDTTESLKGMSQWIRDNKKQVETLTTILGSFYAAWKLVSGVAKIWSGISAAAASGTGALAAAFAAITGPVGIAIASIGALIASGVFLARNWEWVKASIAWTLSKIAANFATVINGIIEGINAVIRGLNGIKFPDWMGIKPTRIIPEIGKLPMPREVPAPGSPFNYVPKYEDGTNFVPSDQLALLHKGEQVIPADQGAPYRDTSEVERLLKTLIQVVRDSGDGKVYLDGRQVGEVLLNPLLKAASRQGKPYPVKA